MKASLQCRLAIAAFAAVAAAATCLLVGGDPMTAAAREGDAARVRQLLAGGCDPDIRSSSLCAKSSQWTPLMWAVWNGHTEVVEALLEGGADPNAVSNLRQTPLVLAVGPTRSGCGADAAVVRLLLRHGAGVNALQPSGETPLHIAARRQQVEHVRILLEAGAAPNAGDREGVTPLLACLTSNPKLEVVMALLEHGARLDGWGDRQPSIRSLLRYRTSALDAEVRRLLIGRLRGDGINWAGLP